MHRAWSATWGHFGILGPCFHWSHSYLGSLCCHRSRAWWSLVPNTAESHVWVHDPAATKIRVNVHGTCYHRRSQEPCVLKSKGCAEPTLPLTGPGIVGPGSCWTLHQESWFCPSWESCPSHFNMAPLLTTGMGDWLWSWWHRCRRTGCTHPWGGQSQCPGPTSLATTQTHIVDLGLVNHNIYPIYDLLENVKLLILQNNGLRDNNTMSKKSFGEGPVMLEWQSPWTRPITHCKGHFVGRVDWTKVYTAWHTITLNAIKINEQVLERWRSEVAFYLFLINLGLEDVVVVRGRYGGTRKWMGLGYRKQNSQRIK